MGRSQNNFPALVFDLPVSAPFDTVFQHGIIFLQYSGQELAPDFCRNPAQREDTSRKTGWIMKKSRYKNCACR